MKTNKSVMGRGLSATASGRSESAIMVRDLPQSRKRNHQKWPQNTPRNIISLVYATGYIEDPVPLIAKRRGLSPGGRFPPSFIHLVIIITGLNKLYNCMFSP